MLMDDETFVTLVQKIDIYHLGFCKFSNKNALS